MRRSRLFTILFLFLLVAGVALAWLIYQQLEASAPPEDRRAAAVQTPEIPALPPLPEFAMAPLLDFTEVIDRPAFSQTRRPPAVQAAAAGDVVASSLELVLKGVIYSDGQRIALFAPKAGGDILRLAKGGSYQGWDLVEVAPNEVLFRRGEREESLALIFETPPSFVPKQNARERGRDRAVADDSNRRRAQRSRDAVDRARAVDDEDDYEEEDEAQGQSDG